MENIMLNRKQSLIKKTFFMIILICGLSSNLQAIDWNTWNPRTLATNLYQRFNSWYSNLLNPYYSGRQTPEQILRYTEAREARIHRESEQLQHAEAEQLKEESLLKQQNEKRSKIVKELKLNNLLREKLELIVAKSGDQDTLWNEIRNLINTGANVNTATQREIEEYGEVKKINDLTALHLAAIDKPDMINFLLEHGANKNQKTADGLTYNDIIKASKHIQEKSANEQPASTQACKQNHHLLEQRLHNALQNLFNRPYTENDWEMVRDIVSTNPSLVNATGIRNWTALHLAANTGNTRMVNFLMGYRANPQLRNSDGMNAFDLAANIIDKGTKEDILKLLSKEFSSAQFGSPEEAHKSITQIFQETQHLLQQRPQTLTPSEQLEQRIGGLVEEFIPKSPQKRLLKEGDVTEASSLPVYY